jgi:hypothetical protein
MDKTNRMTASLQSSVPYPTAETRAATRTPRPISDLDSSDNNRAKPRAENQTIRTGRRQTVRYKIRWGWGERTLRALPPLRLGEVLLRCAGVGEEQRAAPHPTPSPSPSAALGGGGDEEAGGEASAMARWERRWRLVGEARRNGGWPAGAGVFKWKGRGSGEN